MLCSFQTLFRDKNLFCRIKFNRDMIFQRRPFDPLIMRRREIKARVIISGYHIKNGRSCDRHELSKSFTIVVWNHCSLSLLAASLLARDSCSTTFSLRIFEQKRDSDSCSTTFSLRVFEQKRDCSQSSESVTSTTSLSTFLVVGEREDLWHPVFYNMTLIDLANQCNEFTSNIKPSPSCTKFKLTLYQMSILRTFLLIFFAISFQNGCSQVKLNCTKISECPPHFCLYPKNKFVIWESA